MSFVGPPARPVLAVDLLLLTRSLGQYDSALKLEKIGALGVDRPKPLEPDYLSSWPHHPRTFEQELLADADHVG